MKVGINNLSNGQLPVKRQQCEGVSARHAPASRSRSGNSFNDCQLPSAAAGHRAVTPQPPSIIDRRLSNASKTPQPEEFTDAQVGQTASYWLRWVSTRGEKGPWCESVSATIPGQNYYVETF